MVAMTARPVFCELKVQKPAVQKAETPAPSKVYFVEMPSQAQTATENGKIVLQPRVCTLRSFGSDRAGLIKAKSVEDGEDEVSPFFETLSEYIESSKKSQDFEIISGRLAMVVFAATVSMEVVTGNSLFRKMDLEGIAEAAGFCMLAVTSAATFAYFSSARNKVGRIFSLGCNIFIDSLIDQIIDGLFYDDELSDWSDDL